MGYPAQLFDNRLSSLVLLINPWAIQPKNMWAVLKHYSPAQGLLARLFFLHWLSCPGFICPETVSGWLPAVPGCWAIQPIRETPPCFTVNCRHFTAVFFSKTKHPSNLFAYSAVAPLQQVLLSQLGHKTTALPRPSVGLTAQAHAALSHFTCPYGVFVHIGEKVALPAQLQPISALSKPVTPGLWNG